MNEPRCILGAGWTHVKTLDSFSKNLTSPATELITYMIHAISGAHSVARCFGTLFLVLFCAGCTFAPTVNVPDKDLKEAAASVSAGAKEAGQEAGKELGAELGQAGLKAGEQYSGEIREASRDLSLAARSVRDLADSAKSSPAVFGDALAGRLVKDATIQGMLHRVERLAESQERLAEAGGEVPALLAAKIAEFHRELINKEGFLSQQRAAMMEELRQERIDLMKDIDALTLKAIDHAGGQVRKTVEGALGLTIVLVLVLLGLPFAAGFLLGRSVKKP